MLFFVALRGGLAKQRGWEPGLKHRGWVRAFGLVLFGRSFRSFFSWFVLFGRSFRGSFFWFVLLVVLFVVRAFGSCFWFVLLVRAFGGSYVFFFDALKFLEACVARSEVS